MTSRVSRGRHWFRRSCVSRCGAVNGFAPVGFRVRAVCGAVLSSRDYP